MVEGAHLAGQKAAQAAELLAAAKRGLHSDSRNKSAACQKATEAVVLFKELGDEGSLAQALQALAGLHLQAGEPKEALSFADEAMDLLLSRKRSIEDVQVIAYAVHALLQLDQPGWALRTATDSKEAFQEAGLCSGEASMLELEASVHAAVGQTAQGERAARQALRLYCGELKDAKGEARALRLLAGVQPGGSTGTSSGDSGTGSAGGACAAAEALLAQVQEPLTQSRAAEVLAGAAALRERCRASGETTAEGLTLLAAAHVHSGLGELTESLQVARAAIEIFEAQGEAYQWGSALAMIARTYSQKGQLQMAQQYARNASRKFAAAGRRCATDASMRLLVAHSMLGGPQLERQPKEAIQKANEGLALARELGDRALQARALGLITKAHSLAGQNDEALQAAERALQLLDDEDVHTRAQLLLHCTDLCLVLGRYSEAVLPASEMVEVAKKDGDAKLLGLAERMLQNVERCQGA